MNIHTYVGGAASCAFYRTSRELACKSLGSGAFVKHMHITYLAPAKGSLVLSVDESSEESSSSEIFQTSYKLSLKHPPASNVKSLAKAEVIVRTRVPNSHH